VTEPGESREDRSRELLRQIWIRNRPTTLERLSVVHSALEALAAGELDADRRQMAAGEAHKLRGILGTYGFADGSELAAEAEELLDGADAGGGAGEVSERLAAFTRSLPEA
jgi:HPt (histidine-containing phosphotransfer) domain-containing protein